jgi:hypothetical protein
MANNTDYGFGKRIATVVIRKADGTTFTQQRTVGKTEAGAAHSSSSVELTFEDELALSVPGCSCGMADRGAPGHEGHQDYEGDTAEDDLTLETSNEPTMSEWAESRRASMTPQTIEMNERLHAARAAADLAEAKTADYEARAARQTPGTNAARPDFWRAIDEAATRKAKVTTKAVPAPLPQLPDLLPGARVNIDGVNGTVKSTDNGTHMIELDNGSLTLASSRDLGLHAGRKPRTGIEAIRSVDAQLEAHSPADDTAVATVLREINEGGFADIRHVALFDIRLIEQNEAALAGNRGIDSSDWEAVNPQRHAVDTMGDRAFLRDGYDVSDDAHTASGAANDAGLALAYRPYIGTARFPGWTQEAYDHMVRPWATVHGPVHSDDDAQPKSWQKRPLS